MSGFESLLDNVAKLASLKAYSEKLINGVKLEDIQKMATAITGTGMNVGDGTLAALAFLAQSLMQAPKDEKDVKDTALLYSFVFMEMIRNVGMNNLEGKSLQ